MKSKFETNATIQKGFTIIELLVTLVIVAILASASLPLAELTVKRNKEAELRRSLRDIRVALDAYKRASDEGKIPLKAGESGYPATLEKLTEGVVDLKANNGTKIYFLRKIPRDPFFSEPEVAASKTWGKRSYASSAEEPKEGSDVYDVYSMAGGSGLNAIPYRDW